MRRLQLHQTADHRVDRGGGVGEAHVAAIDLYRLVAFIRLAACGIGGDDAVVFGVGITMADILLERSGAVGKAVLYVTGKDDALSRKVLFDSTPPILAELTPEPTFAL